MNSWLASAGPSPGYFGRLVPHLVLGRTCLCVIINFFDYLNAFRDFVTLHMINNLHIFMLLLPWPAVIATASRNCCQTDRHWMAQ